MASSWYFHYMCSFSNMLDLFPFFTSSSLLTSFHHSLILFSSLLFHHWSLLLWLLFFLLFSDFCFSPSHLHVLNHVVYLFDFDPNSLPLYWVAVCSLPCIPWSLPWSYLQLDGFLDIVCLLFLEYFKFRRFIKTFSKQFLDHLWIIACFVLVNI